MVRSGANDVNRHTSCRGKILEYGKTTLADISTITVELPSVPRETALLIQRFVRSQLKVSAYGRLTQD